MTTLHRSKTASVGSFSTSLTFYTFGAYKTEHTHKPDTKTRTHTQPFASHTPPCLPIKKTFSKAALISQHILW